MQQTKVETANRASVSERIKKNYSNLTVSEKRITHWLGREVTKMAFLTLNELSSRAGVSEATIIRFARKLGYDNYPDLQKRVQREMQQKFSLEGKLLEDRMPPLDGTRISQSYQIESNNLKRTYEALTEDESMACAHAIASARKIAIVGFRASYGVAAYLGFMLNLIRGEVSHLTLELDNLNEQMLGYSEKDLCVAFSLQRPARRTVEVVDFAKSRQGMTILSITDSAYSPLVELSDHTLIGESEGLFNSYTSIMSLCQLLIQLSTNLLGETAKTRLRALDSLNANDVYLD